MPGQRQPMDLASFKAISARSSGVVQTIKIAISNLSIFINHACLFLLRLGQTKTFRNPLPQFHHWNRTIRKRRPILPQSESLTST